MSQGKNGENNENSDIDELDIQKISLFFVDSLFNENLKMFKPKDTINSKTAEFNPQSSNQSNKDEHKLKSKEDQPHPPPSNQVPQKTNKKINNQTENKQNEATPKENLSKNNLKKETKEKASKSKSKNNKINNSYKEKKLIYNISVQNIYRTKKVINANNTNYYNKPNANGKIVNKRKKTYSSLSKNYKAKIESEKEKKIYKEKVRLLENRILALKYHQEEIHRKKLYNDVRQTYLDLKKKEKSDMKQTLISCDKDKKNELDLKRKQIRDQKNSLNKHLKESKENEKITKMEDYQNLQKEKNIVLARINQNNSQYEKYGKGNFNKIKKEREQRKQSGLKKQKSLGKKIDNYYYETCEDNKHETNNLKSKLKKLEKLEIKYMNSLNKARKDMFGNNLEGNVLFKRELIPVQKLDLDKQFEIMPYSINIKDSNKKNKKTTNVSVDISCKTNINENKNDKINQNNTKK